MQGKVSLLCAIIGLSIQFACVRSTQTPSEMIAAADAIDKKLVEAFNNKDVDAYMAIQWHSPNLSILDEGEFVNGWDAWKTALVPYFKKLHKVKFEYTDARNIASRDVVIGQQKWRLERSYEDGTTKVFTGLHSDVKAMRDGKWVIISETYVKLDTPPPEAPKK